MFQESNAPYLIAAYIVFLGGMALYLVSLKLRSKNISRDEDAIRQIEAEMKETGKEK
jgi:hypothetical protein